ncbi:hypothetical protein LX32DRAFT_321147 [Colletotrichum zoysiae]|uniref:Zn(2)-C6 fungal-type domain-containing protein n=1 Tax=Colletotrichum zoysiae TaxID=1216348 RepID=A0AAD9HJZ3_9PEZI|nr:hypothetical protein LX32DRAFT_321147 [Colletotrichum zoysiae]
MSNRVHPRPMRLGTRSCAECRRRKVRCIFPAAHPPCHQCGLRGIPCNAQRPAGQQHIGSSGGLSSLGEERLKQRLADIEISVRDIWASLSETGTSPSLTVPTPGALSTTPEVEDHVGVELELMPDVENAIHATVPDESNMADDSFGFWDAPLLTLVKAAGMTEELQSASSELSTNGNEASDAVHLPESLMLQDEDLLTVLVATVQYWPIWPPWQYGALPPTMRTLQTGGVEFAALFLSHMLRSSSPCIVAKALFWLSLCIQQAPKTLQLSRCELSQETLLASYMRTADSLLASAGTGETLHGIEARLIQHKLYLNMGWPRQAWLTVRRAADGALLLRLHRALDQKGGGGGGEEDRKVAIWTEICHLDTTFALILGLPSTVPPSAGQRAHDDGSRGRSDPLRTLQLRLYDLAASVVARNQSPQPSYPATVQIGHELEGCRALMPDSWWHEPPPADQPFAQLYARQVTKVQYFLLAKLLHLPFMLSADAGSESSCVSAASASRCLISAYLGLKGCGNGGLFLICETLEFQAFGAGITLMIRLLSPGSGGRPDDGGNGDEDWRLVEALTASLRRTASLMRCKVAGQAAEVLGLLTQAARGAYAGPDRYDVVLPYFGKITIALSRGWETADLDAWNRGSQQQQQQQQPAPPPFGTVEFSANAFDVVHFPGCLEGELGGDWSSMADVDIDIGFDWTQTFTFDNNNKNINHLL